jgi:hypothetical protein
MLLLSPGGELPLLGRPDAGSSTQWTLGGPVRWTTVTSSYTSWPPSEKRMSVCSSAWGTWQWGSVHAWLLAHLGMQEGI